MVLMLPWQYLKIDNRKIMTKKQRKWNVKANKSDESLVLELKKALNISEVLSTLIVNRGYTTSKEAKAFIS